MRSPDEILKAFYDDRSADEPEADPEAGVRYRKALRLAGLASDERVLDVGCKWGGLGVIAREHGLSIHYTGIELSDEHAKRAASFGLDVRRGDANGTLPLPDCAYDCVFCLEVLEHVVTPVHLLREIRRVLKPAGRVVVSVPNPYSWVEIYRELFRKDDPEGHLGSFTLPIMRNVLSLAGLSLQKRLGTSLRLPHSNKIVSVDGVFARSWLYLARPASRVRFSGSPVWVENSNEIAGP